MSNNAYFIHDTLGAFVYIKFMMKCKCSSVIIETKLSLLYYAILLFFIFERLYPKKSELTIFLTCSMRFTNVKISYRGLSIAMAVIYIFVWQPYLMQLKLFLWLARYY